MAALPSVTQAAILIGPPTATPRHRPSPRLFCGIFLLAASTISGPTSAQTRPSGETADAPRQDPTTAPPPTTVSMARIRRALALRRPTELPGVNSLGVVDRAALVDVRSTLHVVQGFTFLAGMDPFSFMDPTAGPVPMGGPTHRAMMSIMTPREFSEARGSDVLGIATASAFSLVPYAVKGIRAIAGWLFGDGDDGRPENPVLTQSEATLALASLEADERVLDVAILQRGRTVGLSLVVPADTSSETARALGERFVRLVKTLSSTEPTPTRSPEDDQIGAGDYDYIVRISSPTETVIALGGKATTHTKINW